MKVGVGVPSSVPGCTREELLASARRADELGFASVGAIDRIVYPNYEPLVALSAVAAVTERVLLTTAVLIVPNRLNAALLAKQAASLQVLSGGRFVMGAALGARADDYVASGTETKGRGRRFDAMLHEIGEIWKGEERGTAGAIGPVPVVPPPIVIGGSSDASFARAARYGTGWIAGGGTSEGFDAARSKLSAAWADEGRSGEPRAMAMAYCALGVTGEADADAWVASYYGFAGAYADTVRGRVATSILALKDMVASYADQGCDELILFPCSPDPDQIDRVGEVTL